MSMVQPTLSERVFGAALWNTLLLPANFVVGLITSVLYYRILSLEQVGLIFLLTSLASTVGLYADLGIERALPRYLPEVEQHGGQQAVRALLNQVIKLKLAILLVLIIILNLLAPVLIDRVAQQQRQSVTRLEQQSAALRVEQEASTEVLALDRQISADRVLVEQIETSGRWFLLAVSALVVLGAIFDVYMQFLTAYFKQRAWNLIVLTNTLVQPILVSILLLLGEGIGGVLLGLVITPLVSISLALWQTRRATRAIGIQTATVSEMPLLRRRFMKYAAVSYLMQVSAWFYDLAFVVFILSATLGLRELAILSFAYKFAKDFLAYVWTPMGGLITPLLTRIKVGRDQTALRDAHASLTRILLLLIVPAGVGLTVLVPNMLVVMFPKYVDAATLIIIFVGFTFAESLLSVPHNVLMVYERYRVVIFSRLVALLSIPAVLFALPHYGLIGVAVAVGLVRVASRLVTVVYGVRKLDLTLPFGFALRVTSASAVFAAVLLLLQHFWPAAAIPDTTSAKVVAMLPLFGLVVLGASLYLGVLRLLGGLDEVERRRVLGLRLPFKQFLSRVL